MYVSRNFFLFYSVMKWRRQAHSALDCLNQNLHIRVLSIKMGDAECIYKEYLHLGHVNCCAFCIKCKTNKETFIRISLFKKKYLSLKIKRTFIPAIDE